MTIHYTDPGILHSHLPCSPAAQVGTLHPELEPHWIGRPFPARATVAKGLSRSLQ